MVTGQNVDNPKRRQPKRRQTKTSTNRNVDRPNCRQTNTSTEQNVDRPKRRQTKTSTNQNVDKPKRRQTKTLTNQNVDRPKRRHLILVHCWDVLHISEPILHNSWGVRYISDAYSIIFTGGVLSLKSHMAYTHLDVRIAFIFGMLLYLLRP